jgi:hypothetical protein
MNVCKIGVRKGYATLQLSRICKRQAYANPEACSYRETLHEGVRHSSSQRRQIAYEIAESANDPDWRRGRLPFALQTLWGIQCATVGYEGHNRICLGKEVIGRLSQGGWLS